MVYCSCQQSMRTISTLRNPQQSSIRKRVFCQYPPKLIKINWYTYCKLECLARPRLRVASRKSIHQHHTQPWPQFSKNPPLTSRVRGISARAHPYTHPQNLKVLKHCAYIYDMVGGCSLWGFGASTMTLQHHSDLAMPQFS